MLELLKHDAVFVTGIGTDVGKTVVSSILVEACRGGYWKPVQCGNLRNSDTGKVRKLVSHQHFYFHRESHRFRTPCSPNLAAQKEGAQIRIEEMALPARGKLQGPLIVEGAGGILVPLDDRHTMLDLVKKWGIPVVVVSQNYLGSLNHTLLTLEVLKMNSVPVLGLVFNGKTFREGEAFLLHKSGLPCLGRVKPERTVDKIMVTKYARQWEAKWKAER